MLDNAPTYLIFASLAAERAGVGTDLGALAAQAPHLLEAISIGAVFMGANTYIGNGPNLLVKAVAESAGDAKVAMPNFIAYAGLGGNDPDAGVRGGDAVHPGVSEVSDGRQVSRGT